MAVDREVVAGQRVYTRRMLAAYDPMVLGLVCRRVWHCPSWATVALYDRNVGPRHLELGAGTGYFLDRCRFPDANPDITVVDLNPEPLRHAAHRLRRYRPTARQANVFEPLPFPAGTFDSVAMSLLLHCLPGAGLAAKSDVLTHARTVARSGARLFGSTVLSHGVATTAAARLVLAGLNRAGIFANRHDSLVELRRLLVERFVDVRVEVRGQVALFEATVP